MFRIMAVTDEHLLDKIKVLLAERSRIKFGYPIFLLRSMVSSPRLKDLYVRDFSIDGLVEVGDSYLDKFTMLADQPQKTYGISITQWKSVESGATFVDEFHFRDTSVIKLQVWAFDPNTLTAEQLRIAVAVSFTELEIFDEPRLGLALDELLEDIPVTADYEYKFGR
ncbi:hypothetical protein GR140_02510 [Pseudomonas putida]|uniref:hypothetical protein n=1 Tax=Pseudomonas putida TaxID=303 RepID=UPI001BB04CF5|nr:hypothetical protein [Pseudomonas putida]QUG87672.1 hypothetical protein GR140_02510 [Pseudomonas putida]